MDNLEITITPPNGSPYLHITVRGKGHHFHHTEVFHPNVPVGHAVAHTRTRFLEELKAWVRFVEGLS